MKTSFVSGFYLLQLTLVVSLSSAEKTERKYGQLLPAGSYLNKLVASDFTCPDSNGLYPNPDDCTTFWQCANGRPFLQECPGDLVFNPSTLECDYLYNVPECNGGIGATSTTPVTSTSTTTTESTTTTSTTTESVSTSTITESTTTSVEVSTASTSNPSDFKCPEPDGFFPVPEIPCGSDFYNCVRGVPTLQTCPNGAIFDPVALICVPPNSATCYFECDPSVDGFFPIPYQCTQYYYICVVGELFVDKCPGNSFFDPESLQCSPEENVSCKKSTSANPTTVSTTSSTPGQFVCPPGSGQYPYPGNCTLYYVCSEGNLVIIATCPLGQVFNPNLSFCDDPANVPGCQ